MEISKKSTGETLFDLTSYAGDTLANLSQPQGNAMAQKTRDIYGHGYDKPLANYDQNTQSWRMCEDTLVSDSPPFLGKWPASGMTRSGKLFPQPRRVPRTLENALSLWPTPTTQEVEHPNAEWYLEKTRWRRRSKNGPRGHSMGLADAVVMWPTPQANDAKNPYARTREHSLAKMLGEAVLDADPSTHGGKLNPMWVEWLMGFPLGWTDLEDSETP
jgi:hypothetical protein